jgi:hypothetical protein
VSSAARLARECEVTSGSPALARLFAPLLGFGTRGIVRRGYDESGDAHPKKAEAA